MKTVKTADGKIVPAKRRKRGSWMELWIEPEQWDAISVFAARFKIKPEQVPYVVFLAALARWDKLEHYHRQAERYAAAEGLHPRQVFLAQIKRSLNLD